MFIKFILFNLAIKFIYMDIVKTKPEMLSGKNLRGRPAKYDYSNLKPGQTLVIKIESEKDAQRVRSSFHNYKKRSGIKFKGTVRNDGNNIYVNRIN